jgi:CheY-like chemotaxis protein
MDIAMPIMDGYTATRIIREFEKNFALKGSAAAGSSTAEVLQQHQ